MIKGSSFYIYVRNAVPDFIFSDSKFQKGAIVLLKTASYFGVTTCNEQ